VLGLNQIKSLEGSGLSLDEVAFLGDAESDKVAAEGVGIHFVLRITSENNDINVLHKIQDLTGLQDILEEIGQ
jgi:hypothetical protein